MTAFESFLYRCLSITMEKPALYGAFHIISILLTIALTVGAVFFLRNASDKKMRIIVFITWFIITFFEVGKQLLFSMNVTGDLMTWEYNWYSFPFQFCSTPYYTLPFIFLLKDCKLRRAIMSYIATFSLFAGFIVMVLPTSVFNTYTFINTQTMVLHGFQVVLGVWMAVYNRDRLNLPFFASGLITFVGFSSVAMVLNLIMPKYLAEKGIETAFNMFYISPYYNNDLPVLSVIYPALPYPVYLIVYFLGFGLAAAIMYGIEKGIVALTLRKQNRVQDQIPD